MSIVIGQKVGKAFLEALGLSDRGVRSLTLRIALDEPVTVVIEEMDGLEVPNGAEGLMKAAALLKQYNLVEAEGELDDQRDTPMQTYVCMVCGHLFRMEPYPEHLAPVCPQCHGQTRRDNET